MKSILDPTFKYTPANETDLRRTFARVRREQIRESTKAAQDKADLETHLINFEARRAAAKKT